ncbi:glycogen debranching enzyme, glucanotransferase domain-containing protein [Ditylenchus destructor]|uniref:Glycogen debranching enzyme, glucanotransferase domain-containing protein n=1 Tax=Ditylenchus destructor TaxID=166010 RepID=A0AAD4N1J3_9BILA|nr:glycogen debranching enzyme, glucanotransferase domain-containing protein [Ditylenchus destructor]
MAQVANVNLSQSKNLNGVSPSNQTTLSIELNKDEFLDSRVVRLEKGWKLQFVCGEGLLGHGVHLRICDTDISFNFNELDSLSNLDSGNVHELLCDFFGAYKYEFFLSTDLDTPVGRGYFCIVPQWNIANSSRIMSLNALSVITHLAKLLGPLSEWEDRLRVAKEAGYNVIHLTPVQTLGVSNSSYSIADYHRLNPIFEANFDQLKQFIHKMAVEWHVLTLQDVVWNHTAKNANWLWEHPECSFNCDNSPHLRPAYIVDRALQQFSREIADSKWEHRGLPAVIDSNSHLVALREILETEVLPPIQLYEFFQANINKCVEEFRGIAKGTPPNADDKAMGICVPIVQDPEFRRFGSTVNLEHAVKRFNIPRSDATSEEDRLNKCCDEFRAHLQRQNDDATRTALDHCFTAINAVMGHVAYERVAAEGPRRGAVSDRAPLVTNYFLHRKTPTNWQEEEKLAYNPATSKYLMACNGWIMNADPLVNFAEPPSNVYLRRELVCWGDCVKLNYGQKPEDCPYLWNYMKEYSEKCAEIFHGFRIDNCHSTPIHVAEYLLNAARKVRKDLYVVAELFTGSEELDNLFVNRLGITSLIRECQNAPDSHEQGRFVYRYGGDPVGAFHSKSTRPAIGGVAHALLYDQTHDNPSPFQKRTAYDYVPTAAMTAMAYCASGTTRGYDEFVPFHIDVVHEKRLYHNWEEISADSNLVGMIKARRLFNDLHTELSANGFSEIFVDQVNEDIVAITRHNPRTHESVLLISHCCFSQFKWTPDCKSIHIADDIASILFEVKTVESPMENGVLEAVESNQPNGEEHVQKNVHERIHGLSNFTVEIYENVPLNKSLAVDIDQHGSIHFKLFTSGSVIAFKINPKKETATACDAIEKIVEDETLRQEAESQLRKLDLQTFNYLLYRCEAEEQSEYGQGAYAVPEFEKLVYCGLQGIQTVLKRIQETDDLGHPVCSNLRAGNWIVDYTVARMKRLPELTDLAKIGISKVPQLNITQKLAFSSVSFLACINSAKLPQLSSKIAPEDFNPPSLAAGLPHFAEGIWRNWGRDTFIALPGVLLLTGRFAEARNTILAFAGTLRHGLIPNLLAEGKSARYNCRDAVWFWLAAIIQYVEMAPNGEKLLNDPVFRIYPTDDAHYGDGSQKEEPLHATMYEALQRHFEGISFRERNAGHQIDEHMTDPGFNVNAYIDHETGLVFGGNPWNCGTWMDKMGSSDKAGNRGQPATPRDGAAVELQGLALFTAKKLAELAKKQQFPYARLEGKGKSWTWDEWANILRQSFREKFFVRQENNDKFVNRKGIVKDCYGSSAGFTDFQLRPNFCIALNAAPDILEAEEAWSALEIAGKILGAPLGICTLDPEDWAYNGNYNNDDDGTNKQTAKGWNYHQGPEWLWVASIYLSAKLKVAHRLKASGRNEKAWIDTLNEMKTRIHTYSNHLKISPWGSLPELTNQNGSPCLHSCPAQAWSVGCFLEALHTLDTLLNEK